MSHWQLLDLTPEADERAVKRAYARLLKIHRPDEDAAAFQQLREAYESALAELRWRAQWEEEDEQGGVPEPQPVLSAIDEGGTLSVAPAPAPVRAEPEEPDYAAYVRAIPEPVISMGQIRQWFAEGHEHRLLSVLPQILASEWMLSFDRRQWFEEQLLDCLEHESHWSPAFFDQLAAGMDWSDAKGHIPCSGPRWRHLMDLRAAAFEVDSVRRDVQSPNPDAVLSFLFVRQSDLDRRQLADGMDADQWAHCQQVSESFEQRNPTTLQRLGLELVDDWRAWLPRTAVPFCLYLWLLACGFMALKFLPLAETRPSAYVLRVVSSGLLAAAGSVWAYVIWRRIAMWLTRLDMPLSRAVLPDRLYRRGAGLLILRHVVPCAALSWLAAWHLRELSSPWWPVPLAVFPLLLYLADATLRGTIPAPWSRMYQAMTRPTDEAGW